jgi:3-methylcrotonyl-CoA carboxylase alpha subunit
MSLDGERAEVRSDGLHNDDLALEFNAVRHVATVTRQDREFTVVIGAESWRVSQFSTALASSSSQSTFAPLAAPLHGTVVQVAIVPGSRVFRGQTLMRLECMKLEYSVVAPEEGTIDAVHYAPGQVVERGALLLDFTPS